ncbi:MAG: DUF4383 domain-containing protein [Solirubrobacteraceae bacterium]
MSPRIVRPLSARGLPQPGARVAKPGLRAVRPHTGGQATQHIGPAGQDLSRPFALLVGVGYLAVGLIGFVVTGLPGIVTSHGHSLLGFELNPFHNLVHIVIGLAFIVVSRVPDSAITQGVLIGGGTIYLAAALLGFLNKLPILAIHGAMAPDNFLHLFSGAAAVLVGLLAARRQSRSQPALP